MKPVPRHATLIFDGACGFCTLSVRLLRVVLETRVPLRLYAAPSVVWLQELAYSLIASNRSRLPGDTLYCRQQSEGYR